MEDKIIESFINESGGKYTYNVKILLTDNTSVTFGYPLNFVKYVSSEGIINLSCTEQYRKKSLCLFDALIIGIKNKLDNQQ